MREVDRRQLLGGTAAAAALSLAPRASARAQAARQVVRIADLEVMSGPFSLLGETLARSNLVAAEDHNEHSRSSVRFELSLFDSKGSAQEAQAIFSRVVDQGFRYIAGGSTSAIAAVLIDAVNRHNQRNPGRAVVYLNHSAIDPAFTMERCSHWHFAFDPNVNMKMRAMAKFVADDSSIRKVFLINQDYSFGHQVANAAKEELAARRPDIEIVGEDLHPFGRVRDFTPYVAKMKAAGTDTVITGNFGTDLILLIRAASDAGLNARFLTLYANALGAPTALGEAGAGRTLVVGGLNMEGFDARMTRIRARFKQPNPRLELFHAACFDMIQVLGAACDRAGSTDPIAVARAMSGLTVEGPYGPITMRAADHQLLAPLYVQRFGAVDGAAIKVPVEDTRFGFETLKGYASTENELPAACSMRRPA